MVRRGDQGDQEADEGQGEAGDQGQPDAWSSEQGVLYARDMARVYGSRRAMSRRMRAEAAPHKLLIADDDASLRLLVAATFASEEYEILEAGTGTQALALVREQRPEVVLLDNRMPEMDGLEVCRRIKVDPDLADTVVVMLTNAASSEDQLAGAAAGVDRYLTKPFSPLQLIETVEAAIATR